MSTFALLSGRVLIWPIAAALVVIAFSLIYYFAPDLREQHWYWITPAAAAVQPMIQNYSDRPEAWVNLYSPSDIVSGSLDFYDVPNQDNAKDKTPFRNSATHERAVKNLPDPTARTPLAAHI